MFFFFFQAEDGIRDVAVTGVQTCALPISNHRASCRRYRRCHTPSSGGCRGGWKLVEIGGGRSTSASTILHNLHNPPAPASDRAPGGTRTPGQRFRKPLLYPPELQGLSL